MAEPKPDLALQDAVARIKQICLKSHGRSQYFPYGGSGYKASVTHYYESSAEVAVGAVQPGSEHDLAEIVKAIAETHVKFAIKCGGHSSNPKFSSTKGIQICLSRLHHIVVDKPNMRVRVGAGCLFEELYQVLCPLKLNIVGGTGQSGVGVSGWMLGGGYSVKTNQYGLGVDNIISARVVLPDGSIKVASDTENQELFFAIKGGGNNFGIVTEFTLKAHHQGKFRHYTFEYDPKRSDEVRAAFVTIIGRQDKKANMLALYMHYIKPGETAPVATIVVHCVYDGDYPTPDPFQELKDVPNKGHESNVPPMLRQSSSFLEADLHLSHYNGTSSLLHDISELGLADTHSADNSNSEAQRPKIPMGGIGQFPRGRWGNVMVDEFTSDIIKKIEEESYKVAKKLGKHGGTQIAMGVWPFTKSMFDNVVTGSSAFPHEKGKPNCPTVIQLTWEGKKNDAHWSKIMKSTIEELRKNVQNEASKALPHMVTTAFCETTTLEDLYRDNLPKLKRLRRVYDPAGVMDRTGGFRIPRAQETTDETKQ